MLDPLPEASLVLVSIGPLVNSPSLHRPPSKFPSIRRAICEVELPISFKVVLIVFASSEFPLISGIIFQVGCDSAPAPLLVFE